MQDFEKRFIEWTIAQMKLRSPVNVNIIISNLWQKNPELGAYAEEIAPSIKTRLMGKYEALFQKSLVEVCMTAPDP